MKNFFIGSIIIISGMLFGVGCQAVSMGTPEPEITSPPPAVVPIKTEESIPTESILGEKVIFATEDDITLAGTLFGDGEVAVILAHQGTYRTDQTSWYRFARVLADEGFTALTFDFRGKGESGGNFVRSNLIYDVNAAIAFLRERGYKEIICIGASMGGTSCVRAALDDELSGLVVFASTLHLATPTSVKPHELAELRIPKLYLTSSGDNPQVVRDIGIMFEISSEPKDLHIFQGMSEHGTELFDTDVGDELTELLLTFITGLVE